MVRLGYLVDSEIPSRKANSVHAVKMSSAFSNNNINLTLFCRGTKEGNITDAFSVYGIKRKFEICAFKPYVHKGILGKIDIILNGFRQSLQVKKSKKIDLIYARARVTLFFSMNISPYMLEAHEWPNSKMLRIMERIILKNRNCKGLVVISNALKKKYIENYPFLLTEKVHVLHDGADAVQKEISPLNIDNNKSDYPECVIGYLGHLYPGKCMEIILEIANQRPNYLFHIVGGTEQWISYWKEELNNRNIDNIIMYGFVENREVGAWYSAFDIFLLPLLNKILVDGGKKRDIGRWISPLKLFEAMAYGNAILASRISTLQEVIEEGEEGLMASPDNIDEWLKQLDLLVQNPELRKKLGRAAKKKLEKSYTWDIRAKRILDILMS